MLRRSLLVVLGSVGVLGTLVAGARLDARRAVLLVGEGPASVADRAVARRLEVLGYRVTLTAASASTQAEAEGAAVVLVSATARLERLRWPLASAPTPIVTWHVGSLPALGLTGAVAGSDFGTSAPTTELAIADPAHPLAARLAGRFALTEAPLALSWGLPASSAVWVASPAEDTNRSAAFAYEAGAEMARGRAAARRVALPFAADAPAQLTAAGWRLFDAAVAWAVSRSQADAGDAVGESAAPLAAVTPSASASPSPSPFPSPAPDSPALMVVSSVSSLSAGDKTLRAHLEARGYLVSVKPSASVTADDAINQKVVIVTGTSGTPPKGFGDVAVPFVVLKANLFGPLGMTGNTTNTDYGNATDSQITITDSAHLLAARLSGTVTVTSSKQPMPWGSPGHQAAVVGTLASHPAIFAYARGATMSHGTAASRRVGLFVSDFAATKLTRDGWTLFDAAVDWAAGFRNHRPVVNAGPDAKTAVALPVLLDGSVTDDGAPNPVPTIDWNYVSGPTDATCVQFEDPHAASTNASFCAAGVFTLRLTADDGDGPVSDEVTVTVADANNPPTIDEIDAGDVNLIKAKVSDDGIPSPPGKVSVEWSVVSGTGRVVFGSPKQLTTTVSYSVKGDYTLRLTASDGVATTSQEFPVTAGPPQALLVVGHVPIDPGGADQLLVDRLQAVGFVPMLQGAGGMAPFQAPAAAALVVVSPTAGASTAVSAALKALPAPVVVASADLFDDFGLTGTAAGTDFGAVGSQVELEIQMPLHPLAAGLTSVVNVTKHPAPFGWATPTSSGAIVASVVGSPRHAVVLGYPEGAAMVGLKAPASRVGLGLSAQAMMGATDGGRALIDAALRWANGFNTAPTVHAGAPRATQPGVPLFLAGLVADDGLPSPPGATTIAWSLASGPGSVVFGDATQPATTATFSDEGTYVLQLTASDGDLTTQDTLTVSVSAGNQAPVVDAGPDRTTRTPGTVTLHGSASDDGLPASAALAYAWTVVSGPAPLRLATPKAAETAVTCTVGGTYVLRLSVSDGSLSGSDDVTLTCGVSVLMVVGGATLTHGEEVVKAHLESLGEFVEVSKAAAVHPTDVQGKLLIWLSDSSAGILNPSLFATAPVPVVTVSSAMFNGMRLTGAVGGLQRGSADAQASVRMPHPSHVLSAGLEGVVSVSTSPGTLWWGVPSAQAIPVAGLETAPGKAVIFAYEQGARMGLGLAPARRLAIGFSDAILTSLDAEGALLLDTALRWALRLNLPPLAYTSVPPLVPAGTPVAISGIVFDDGLPNPPGRPAVTWGLVSGAGTVAFADATALSTTVTLSEAGDYVLRFSASDGVFSASSDVHVKAFDPATPNEPPTVDIAPGDDISLRLPTHTHLSATVTDDGRPVPSKITLAWTLASGPKNGRVTISSPKTAETDVRFLPPYAAGGYVIRLTASDGELQTVHDVTIHAAAARHALLVASTTVAHPEDKAARTRLEDHGYVVRVVDGTAATPADAVGQDVVLLSATVNAGGVKARFRAIPQPVLVWEQGLFPFMGMTGGVAGTDFGVDMQGTAIDIANTTDPLAAHLSGLVTVNTQAGEVRWGVVAGAGVVVATLKDDPGKATIFYFEKGAALKAGASAAARRVGMFVRPDLLTADGWTLFDAAVAWLDSPPVP
jgi:hypothetical protein